MPQYRKLIKSELIEYRCICGGLYRLKYKAPHTTDCRYTWLHACSKCRKELEFSTPYPMIETTSNNVKRKFILNDAKPPATTGRAGHKASLDNSFSIIGVTSF
jgi:hypothetical protein